MFRCKDGDCPITNENRCCHDCTKKDECVDACPVLPNDCKYAELLEEGETALAAFTAQYLSVMRAVAEVVNQKKALEAQEKEMKDRLKAAMETHGIKQADNELLKITYVAATTATTVDSAKLKKKYPAIAAECVKESAKSAYVKIEVKGGES